MTDQPLSVSAARPHDDLGAPAELEACRYLQKLLELEAAISIGADRQALWRSRLNPVARRHGLSGLGGLAESIRAGDRDLKVAVIDAMTTNETMFFRDGPVFDDIVTELVPQLLDRMDAGSRLTIWSAACSSGQEVYSLAMQLDQAFPDLVRAGRIRLLASDLSHEMVSRVREGCYSTLEVRRGLPEEYLRQYFTRRGDEWQVTERIRRVVLCRQLNLMESLAPIPRCELVLIRNVLIYFSDADRLALLRSIRDQVLRPEGALLLGSSEVIGSAKSLFASGRLSNGVYYTHP
jgi:chemotaxis protein methyltransferase CheR